MDTQTATTLGLVASLILDLIAGAGGAPRLIEWLTTKLNAKEHKAQLVTLAVAIAVAVITLLATNALNLRDIEDPIQWLVAIQAILAASQYEHARLKRAKPDTTE